MTLQVPTAMEAEHDALHRDLAQALRSGGETAEAAKAVAAALHTHFKKEEQVALPPLGLLAALAKGESSPDADEAARLAERLEAELPAMLDEHRTILSALDALIAAAQAEGCSEVVAFAERLKQHAQTEEQVSYPAAILVGKYIRALQLNAGTENEAGGV